MASRESGEWGGGACVSQAHKRRRGLLSGYGSANSSILSSVWIDVKIVASSASRLDAFASPAFRLGAITAQRRNKERPGGMPR